MLSLCFRHSGTCTHALIEYIGPTTLCAIDHLKIPQPRPESHTPSSSHTPNHTVTWLPRVCHTREASQSSTASQSHCLPNSHNRPPDCTLPYSLTLGLSQHPTSTTRPLSWAPAAASHSFSSFCFSFLLSPLRNLVPVRKLKPFPTQGPGPGRSSQMTDKALPGPP